MRKLRKTKQMATKNQMQVMKSQGVHMNQNKMCHYLEQLMEYKKIQFVLDIRNIFLVSFLS